MNSEKETILLVDDEEAILDISTEYLLQKGYNVITASNGHEAVDILERENIACCFTDIHMPEMDGLELAEHIQKKDMTIPVVIMTGNPTLDNTIKTVKNGVVDFLIKPVSLEQMGMCLQRVLKQKKLYIENIMLHQEIEGKKKIEELNKQLIEKVSELNNFNKIMTDFARISSSRELFDAIVVLGREIVSADCARFYIIPSDHSQPNLIAEAQDTSGEKDFSDDATEALVLEIARDGLPLLITENRGESRKLPENIKSAMIVPMKIREKTFGVVTVFIYNGNLKFDEQCLYHINFLAQKAADTAENIALYETISENLFSTLRGFVKAVEMKDAYTKEHSNRVAEMSVILAKELNCSEEELNIIDLAGRLHDIGKIGIADNILLKPDRLTDEEFEIIKEHPNLGSSIVGQLGLWSRETEVIKHHHERFDGNGYPDRLKGYDIPFLARILSVADAYDAMASDRAYRRKMDLAKVTRIIEEGSGSQFDPGVVDVYIKLYNEGKWQFD